MKSFRVGVLHRSAFRESGRFPPQYQFASHTFSRANQETTMPGELAAAKGTGSDAVSTLSNYLTTRDSNRAQMHRLASRTVEY
jgi:hypothetical protein